MGLATVTLINSIAALSVSGVKLYGLGGIPQSVVPGECPLIYPKPDGLLSGLQVQIDSSGSAAGKKTVRYTLSYMFLHSAVGEGRGLFEKYPDMVIKALAFLDAIIANDTLTGAVDVQPAGVLQFGPVPDPAGHLFHGCQIDLAVTELVN